ncbi:MAG: MlaD family protein [Solirubrobacteraceae bacterium]
MKRVLAILVTVLGCGALALLGTGAKDATDTPKYWVELDDAFGLISGGDMKIAGVRAGKIGEMKLDRKTNRALVEIEITKTGFGSFRTDVTCQARPQSLIGEYFIDCQPGTAPTELKPGSVIPVERTSSVVAPDLVNNVLRRPFRERFSIIVNELGAAVAGNGANLNEAIKRASPGLQETDKVLHILGQQNRVLANLVRDADQVVGDLADNRKDVARWVDMADRTASASSERADDIAAGFNRLPAFLEELEPAMAQLGNVADEQTPALRTLASAAPNLTTFFDRLGPFADASRPAIRALGEASETGSKAVRSAAPTIAELRRFSRGAPELANNLDIVLNHLDSRDNAVEQDADSPGGKGFTGLEALLQYTFDQTNAVNIYDSSVHILKVAPFLGDCADYADTTRALEDEGEGKKLNDRCGASLGPNGAGLNFPDATRPSNLPPFGPLTDAQQNPFAPATVRSRKSVGDSLLRGSRSQGDEAAATAPAAAAPVPDNPGAPTLGDVIPGAPDVVIPSPPKAVQDLTKGQQATKAQDKLLDYLLGA